MLIKGWYADKLIDTLLFETDKGRVNASVGCAEGIDVVRAYGANKLVTPDPDSVPFTIILLADIFVGVVIADCFAAIKLVTVVKSLSFISICFFH